MFQDFNSYNQYYGMNGAFANQSLNPNNLSNGFDFRNMSGNNNEEVISFSQAVNLIRQSVADEREDELFYEGLIRKAQTEQEKEIISGVRDDERKHNRILRELYFSFTGQMVQMSDMQPMMGMPGVQGSNEGSQKVSNDGMSYKAGLEKALFGELESVVKYRRIMGVMPSGSSYTLLMSIMTDEIRHSAMFNYLIHMAK